MKLGIVLTALCALAVPAAAHATYIDFESVPQGFKGNSFEIDGTTFTTTAPAKLYVGNVSLSGLEICSIVGSGCSGPVGVSFSGPVSNLSFEIDGVNSASSILTAILSLNDGTTAAYTFTNFVAGQKNPNGISFGSLGGILGLSLTSDDDQGVGFDNFSFNSVSATNPGTVPEPFTWVMFIGGFGLIGLSARQRMRPMARANASI